MTSSALRAFLVPATVTMLDVTSTNSTNTTSGETSTQLFNDRIHLIAPTTLLGFTYGIMTILYCMAAHSLFQKVVRRSARSGSQTGRRKTLFYLIYTSVLFVLATLYLAGISQNIIIAYVDNRLYPGGPYQYTLTFMATERVVIMADIAAVIILWMTDALVLCRFIMFYYSIPYARWIIPLPCVMYVGVVVLSIFILQGEAGFGALYPSEGMLLANYVLSFSMNIMATMLIASRLYWHKIQLQRLFGRRMGSPYMDIATMLVESAAVYGTWSLAFLISCVLNSPIQFMILVILPQIQAITPLLIILWIARGKAWNDGKGHGDEEASERLPSSRNARLSIGSRPARVASEPGVEDVCPNPSRNVSRSTVASGGGTKHGDGHGNVIELASYHLEPSNVTIYNMKA